MTMTMEGKNALDVAHADFQFLKLLLQRRVLLRHLLKLGFPVLTLHLQSLNLALVVTGFDICLTESA